MRTVRRVLGYARVSGAEQGRHGTSLEAQRDEIARFCTDRGYPSPRLFVEVESAGGEKLEQRAELRALLATATDGDLVIVHKLDRWSRDIPFAVGSVRELVAKGVGWYSLQESIDAATSHGDDQLGIRAWAADQERKRIRERTVDRRKALRDQGLYIEGLPPIGYARPDRKIARGVAERNTLQVVESDATIVRDVFARCVRGQPIASIVDGLRGRLPERHGWDRKTINRMLRSRTYLGEVRTTAGLWIAAHAPIVARAIWERAQQALDGRRLGGRRPAASARTSTWLLRSIASCGLCGARMGAVYGPKGKDYYACRRRLTGGTCSAPYVPVPGADQAVADELLERVSALRAELASGKLTTPSLEPADQGAKRERLVRRRERTIDLAADGAISRDQLRERLIKIDTELGALELEQEAIAAAARMSRPEVRAEMLRDLKTIERAARHLTVTERRDVLLRLSTEIRITAGASPVVTWKPLERLVSDC